jgi:hypothetical protein
VELKPLMDLVQPSHDGYMTECRASVKCLFIDNGRPKYSEESVSICHYVQHNSHIDCHGIAPVPLR